MKRFIFLTRYVISANMINLGLIIMPESAYKRELLRRLWELRVDVEVAFVNKENEDGE